MDYITFSASLRRKKMGIFTFEDMKCLFPKESTQTIKNNFTRWVAKRYIRRLRRGLYELVEPRVEFKTSDLYVANRLYIPSYVSLETVLSMMSIIPDVAMGVTSVTTRPTRAFKNMYGAFFYRSCKKNCFTGYKLMSYEGVKVLIADTEKALVDFLYYRLRESLVLNFEEERFNKTILKKINWRKALAYAGLFNKRAVEALQRCREYVTC